MKRKQVNAALGIVLLGLGASVWFSREPEQAEAPLLPVAPGDVRSILIEHPGSEAIRLEKSGADWRLTAPVTVAADAVEVAALVDLAKTPVKKHFPATETDLAGLGLAPPKYTITLDGTPLSFGDTEPIEWRRYVQVGEQVNLVEDPPSAALDADFSELVAKTLVPETAVITKVAVPGLTLSRAETGWTLEPADPAATADQMQRLADGWKSARALWNATLAADADAAGEPVTLTLADGQEIKLVVVAREPQLIVGRPDARVQYHLAQSLAAELLALPPPAPAPEAAVPEIPAPGEGAPGTPGPVLPPDGAAPTATPAASPTPG